MRGTAWFDSMRHARENCHPANDAAAPRSIYCPQFRRWWLILRRPHPISRSERFGRSIQDHSEDTAMNEHFPLQASHIDLPTWVRIGDRAKINCVSNECPTWTKLGCDLSSCEVLWNGAFMWDVGQLLAANEESSPWPQGLLVATSKILMETSCMHFKKC